MDLIKCFVSLCLLFNLGNTDVAAQLTRGGREDQSNFNLQLDFSDTTLILDQIEAIQKWQQLYPDSAIATYQSLIDQIKQLEFVSGMNEILPSLGTLYASRGLYDSSLQFFMGIHEYCKHTIRMWPCLPLVYNAIATIHHAKGSYRHAANYYYQSIALNERLGLPFPVGGMNNLAAVLMSLGQYEEAMYYLNKAEAKLVGTNRYALEARVLNNKGQIWMVRGDWQKSDYYFKKALEIGEQNNNLQIQYEARTNLGIWHLWQQQYQQALEWFLKDTSVNDLIDPQHVSTRNQNIGYCFLELKKYDLAEKYLLRALETAEVRGIGRRMLELNGHLAKVYEAKKQYARSLQHLKVQMELKDSIAGIEIIDNAQQLNIKFRTAEKDRQLAETTEQLTKQEIKLKTKNLWIGSISGGVLILAGILFFVIRSNQQRQKLHKNELYILQQQQHIERLKALMQGEEKERGRIARDLHDGIGGMLAALKMNFTTFQHEYEEYSKLFDFLKTEDLLKIREMLDQTSEEVRKTSHNLMPDVLARHGFVEAVKVYCDHVNVGNQLYVNLQVNGDYDDISASFQLALYRIIQELLQNILKHSDASNALLHVNRSPEKIVIIAKDNGRGFDTDNASGGIGLKNIQSRIQALHGKFTIITAIGSGTRVDIEFDLKEIIKSPFLYEDTDSYSG